MAELVRCPKGIPWIRKQYHISRLLLPEFVNRKHKSFFYTWPLPCACILIMTAFICREITAQGNYAEDLASVVQGLFYSAA